MAELYLTTAAIIRHFGNRMRLCETTLDNVELGRDYFVPWPRKEKRVQVLIADG